MDLLGAVNIWDLFTNLQGFMAQLIHDYHSWVYLILFVILFMETGLVVTPFLPGDSLLFVSGYFAATGQLALGELIPILCLGPICGDSLNYWIGRYVGPKVFRKEHVRLLNRRHLDRTHAFYQRHGGKAIAIGRFLPIIRTFVPFVAGIGNMHYGRFISFSAVGTVAWINVCVLAGYFFGGRPFVQKHFELVIVAIILISLLPAAAGFLRHRLAKPATTASTPTQCEEVVEERRPSDSV